MTIIVHSSQEFREAVLTELNFLPNKQKYCTIYQDSTQPKMGHFLLYQRPGYYEFGIADYTIPHPFQIHFENPQRLVRFGTVYKGTTEFQLDNEPVSSFKPSSFFVVEKDIKGTQAWSTGQHFHGAEITIYESYFKEVVEPLLQTPFDFDYFINNYTYNYLPLEVMSILQTMQTRSNNNTLDPLFLESCLLQCISIFIQTILQSPDNVFTNQLHHGKVQIGADRYINLSAQDIQSIQQAHDILTHHIENPPTIEKLSQLVLLNPQKLKVGFRHYYHLSIGEYITSLRMTLATNLLCTTDLSIADISAKVGYNYSGNFIKMFRHTYDCTPLKYRQNSRK
ncbi:MAG TPA: AraC family transcriptional regulator [Firmicutes bacterium]|nr:AraC family transcriptional regulator [Bacillota bacterium]